jgi:hypothetical protein
MRLFLAAAVVCLSLAGSLRAQFKDGTTEPNEMKTGQAQVTRWRAGMIIRASGGACKGITGYAPVPSDWPEQEVSILKEEKTGGARINYELVDAGAKIMTVHVAHLDAGDEAQAIVTVEIRRSTILPPEKTDIYSIPDPAKLPYNIRLYLTPSPKIESGDAKIRQLAKEIGADQEKAWEHVEAIYDWVRKKVKYQNGPLKGALAALKDGTGDCEELSSLFIAICRAAKIPARTVWVPGHCYSEFYLVDKEGKGRWFPCQSAGKREFGGISEMRPILQKGDNFRPLKGTKERQRYMAERVVGAPTRNGGTPQVQWIRETAAK